MERVRQPAVAPEDTCSTCKWFRPFVMGSGQKVLVCRRYPPQVIGNFLQDAAGQWSPITSPAWPTPQPNDVCGEHQVNIALRN